MSTFFLRWVYDVSNIPSNISFIQLVPFCLAEPSVRSDLMEQVPHIAVYCQENKQLFVDAMPNYILPMVVRYLNDANNQVELNIF